MKLTPNFFVVFSEHQGKVTLFAVLLLSSILFTRALGIAAPMLGSDVVAESLLRTTFGFYTAPTLILVSVFFTFILLYGIGVFLSVLIDPAGAHENCDGIKYYDLPAIPYEEELFDFVHTINRRTIRKDGRMSNAALDRYNIDDYGNLID